MSADKRLSNLVPVFVSTPSRVINRASSFIGSIFAQTPTKQNTKHLDFDEIIQKVSGHREENVEQDVPFQSSSEELFKGLLKTNILLSETERKRPRLMMATGKALLAFIQLFRKYRDTDNGVETLFNLIDPAAMNVYAIQCQFDTLFSMEEDELLSWLMTYHRLDKQQTLSMIFSGIVMPESTVVNADATEVYMASFVARSVRDAAALRNFEERDIARTFILGVKPDGLQKHLSEKHLKSMASLYAEVNIILSESEAAACYADKIRDRSLVAKSLTKELVPSLKWNKAAKSAAKIEATPMVGGPLKCFNCAETGHHYNTCPFTKQGFCIPCKAAHRFRCNSCAFFRNKSANVATTADEVESEEVSTLNDIWFDSGANSTFLHSSLHSTSAITPSNGEMIGVTTANGSISPIVGSGELIVKADYVPKFDKTLIAVSQLCRDKNAVCLFNTLGMKCFKRTKPIIDCLNKLDEIAKNNNLVLVTAKQRDGLYSTSMDNLLRNKYISMNPRAGAAFYATADFPELKQLVRYFHEAWMHASADTMCLIVRHKSFSNIPSTLTEKAIRKHFPQCESCKYGNLARKPLLNKGEPYAKEVFTIGEAWEVDIKGKWTDPEGKVQPTFGNAIYLFSAICVISGKKFCMLLKNRQELTRVIDALNLFVKKENRKIRVLFSDDEFVQEELNEYCDKNNMAVRPCPPHEHDVGIGRVERWNKTVQENVCKALYGKESLNALGPDHWRYWGLCALDVASTDDMIPKADLNFVSPDSLWYPNHKPDLLRMPMMPFGTPVMAHIPVKQQTALSGRSFLTFYVGKTEGYNQGVKLRNPKTGMVIIRRTYKIIGSERPSSNPPSMPVMYDAFFDEDTLHVDTEAVPVLGMDVSNVAMSRAKLLPSFDNGAKDKERPSTFRESMDITEEEMEDTGSQAQGVPAQGVPAQGVTAKGMPAQGVQAQGVLAKSPQQKKSKSQLRADRVKARQIVRNETGFGSMANMASSYQRYACAATFLPKCYSQAMRSPAKWEAPTLSEFDSLISEKSWRVPDIDIKLIPPKDIVPSMLIYSEKFNPDGTHNKDKCRLVIRGDKFYDIYHTDTYSSTVRPESVKILLAIAAEQDYEIESVDAKTAFLNSPVEDGVCIYVKRPPGVPDTLMPEIVQLQKYVYGLPLATKKFREHSDRTLVSIGFKATLADSCVYIKKAKDDTLIYISVHVDDFGIMASNIGFIAEVKAELSKTYKLVCTPDLKFYLGMHIKRDRAAKSITVTQEGFIEDSMRLYGIIPTVTTNFPSTPMIAADSISPTVEFDISPPLPADKITLYQAKVGSMNYLAYCTRPDILYPVTMASRQNQAPNVRDMEAIDRILWYVAGTRNLGLRFKSGEGIILYATVDAAYANHIDRKSHTGVTLHIGRNSGSFKSLSKKQTITADSSTVAEFIGTHIAAKEIMWTRAFLKEVGHPQLSPTILFEDNMSTIVMIEKPGNGQKTKHIDVRYNFIREQVLNKVIVMKHLGTKDMTADALTKGLSKVPFQHLRPKLMGMSVNKFLRREIFSELRPVLHAMSAKKLHSLIYSASAMDSK